MEVEVAPPAPAPRVVTVDTKLNEITETKDFTALKKLVRKAMTIEKARELGMYSKSEASQWVEDTLDMYRVHFASTQPAEVNAFQWASAVLEKQKLMLLNANIYRSVLGGAEHFIDVTRTHIVAISSEGKQVESKITPDIKSVPLKAVWGNAKDRTLSGEEFFYSRASASGAYQVSFEVLKKKTDAAENPILLGLMSTKSGLVTTFRRKGTKYPDYSAVDVNDSGIIVYKDGNELKLLSGSNSIEMEKEETPFKPSLSEHFCFSLTDSVLLLADGLKVYTFVIVDRKVQLLPFTNEQDYSEPFSAQEVEENARIAAVAHRSAGGSSPPIIALIYATPHPFDSFQLAFFLNENRKIKVPIESRNDPNIAQRATLGINARAVTVLIGTENNRPAIVYDLLSTGEIAAKSKPSDEERRAAKEAKEAEKEAKKAEKEAEKEAKRAAREAEKEERKKEKAQKVRESRARQKEETERKKKEAREVPADAVREEDYSLSKLAEEEYDEDDEKVQYTAFEGKTYGFDFTYDRDSKELVEEYFIEINDDEERELLPEEVPAEVRNVLKEKMYEHYNSLEDGTMLVQEDLDTNETLITLQVIPEDILTSGDSYSILVKDVDNVDAFLEDVYFEMKRVEGAEKAVLRMAQLNENKHFLNKIEFLDDEEEEEEEEEDEDEDEDEEESEGMREFIEENEDEEDDVAQTILALNRAIQDELDYIAELEDEKESLEKSLDETNQKRIEEIEQEINESNNIINEHEKSLKRAVDEGLVIPDEMKKIDRMIELRHLVEEELPQLLEDLLALEAAKASGNREEIEKLTMILVKSKNQRATVQSVRQQKEELQKELDALREELSN